MAECVAAVRTSEQSLACLQAFILDAVSPLTDLLEKISWSIPLEGQKEDQGLDLQLIEDSVQSALAFLGNAATQFSA